MNMTAEERIKELRQRAHRVRECANRADNRRDYAKEMRTADRYDDEADELEALLIKEPS